MKVNAELDGKFTEFRKTIYTGKGMCGQGRYRIFFFVVAYHDNGLHKIHMGWIQEEGGKNYIYEQITVMNLMKFLNVFNLM